MRTIHVETSCQMSNRLLNDSIWKLETAIGRVRETLLHFHTKRIKHEAWRFYWYCFHLTNTIVLIIFQWTTKLSACKGVFYTLSNCVFPLSDFIKSFAIDIWQMFAPLGWQTESVQNYEKWQRIIVNWGHSSIFIIHFENFQLAPFWSLYC